MNITYDSNCKRMKINFVGAECIFHIIFQEKAYSITYQLNNPFFNNPIGRIFFVYLGMPFDKDNQDTVLLQLVPMFENKIVVQMGL